MSSPDTNRNYAEDPATEAVAFDPFVDDEEDDESDPGTEAVAFDPFADDEDDDDEYETSDEVYAGTMGDMAGVLKGLNKIRKGTPTTKEDTSQRSRRLALDTFRELRGTRRASRSVADGMVELPWIPPIEPNDALIDPRPAVAKKGIAEPVLQPGDIVAGQYEIMGVIAHGGMGWIYLAQDHFVAGRVVVLKGLQSEKNPDEAAAAEAEREFLADITHPGIVKIFNFIDDPRVPGGFTVMEYVGGASLRARRNAAEGGKLEPDVAIAYILEVLPALDYLHSRGVVYNDFKPDNIIVTEDQVKLIDMGAVSGIGAYGFIYGTKGFQAPDVVTQGPTIASDIYTVGRTLASLIVDLPQTDGIYDHGLPTPTTEPMFRRYTSLYRLLARCCDPDPARRFKTVKGLESQLLGVLREVIAVRDGRTYPAQHSLFSPQRTTFGTKHLVFRTDQLIDGISRDVTITPQEVVAALPAPLISRDDIGAAMLQGSSYAEPKETLESLRQAMSTPQYEESMEIPFMVVRTMLELGLTSQAQSWLETLSGRFRDNWRYSWYSGVVATLLGEFGDAQRCFTEVLRVLPGEAAPKLAIAAVSELLLQELGAHEQLLLDATVARSASGLEGHLHELPNSVFEAWVSDGLTDPDWTLATSVAPMLRFHTIRLYSLVWLTNPTTVSSAFGLAREMMREGQVELAIEALDRVPNSSRHYRMARLTAILCLVTPVPGEDLTEARIRRASHRLEKIPTTEPRYLQIKVAVIQAGLAFLRGRGAGAGAGAGAAPLFEHPFTVRGLRRGLARTLREQARVAPYAQHRFALVDMANKVRPATWF